MKEPISKRTRHFYSFGPFRLYVAERELFLGTQPVALAPKAVDTLLVLLGKHGHVVDKDELMRTLWPETFVEEDSLLQQVSRLRKALGERPDGGPYIETIARRGYRFSAGVTESWEEGPTEPRLAVAGPSEEAKPAGRRPLMWLLGAACLLALGVTGWLVFFRPKASVPQAQLNSVPLTTFVGWESWPAISPDGKQVAFSWSGEEAELPRRGSIYVKQVGGGPAVQRTNSPTRDFSPVWSPDGLKLAFCRGSPEPGGAFTIHEIAALGGPDRRLYESVATDIPSWREYRRLAWSPNGQFLAVVDRPSPEEPQSIISLSIESGEKRRLTYPPTQSDDDRAPAFSPDGRTLAFIRKTGGALGIYLLPLAEDGTPRDALERLATMEASRVDFVVYASLDWTADGRSIVFSDGGHLWRIPVLGGEPERLNVGDHAMYPSVSRQGDRLVYATQQNLATDIWRAPGPNSTRLSTGEAGQPERLISSTKSDWSPKYSPDGKQIVFTSARSGRPQIWKCDSDGSNLLPLTDMPSSFPRWSPDGRFVAFHSSVEGNTDIYVISAEGGSLRRLTDDASQDERPSWSKDGKWIYFGSNRSGDWQIWRMPSEGGTAKRVTRNGGTEAYESADGKSVYYAKGWPVFAVWKVPVSGGEETKVLDGVEDDYWDLLKDGICFREGSRAIKFFRFSSQQIERVTELPEGTRFGWGFSVSADGWWVLCTVIERMESDIMLVENFR